MKGLMEGVFLISLSALTYELALTRIASVVMFCSVSCRSWLFCES